MWYFVSPQIIFGPSALDALSEIKGQRAFLVTDATLVKLGLTGPVKAHLKRAGLDVQVFDDVEPDPSLQTVQCGAQMARQYAPDWIVGLGGGSCLDTAKAIWVLYERPDLELEAINPFVELGLRQKARLITIPTTSGTGSEVTMAVVLTDTDRQCKISMINREMVADIAIVDPEMAAGMPPQLTADTGLDALTHAVEGYTCTWHNDLTDGLCAHAVRLIFEYLPRTVADGSDLEARDKMHNAAAIAGLGFGNALVSLAHAMGHALGAVLHIPHGRAVSICLPYTIEFMVVEAPQRFAELEYCLDYAQHTLTPTDAAHAFAARIRRLCETIGNSTALAQLGIDRTRFQACLDGLVEKAFNDGSILTSIRSPSFDELRRLFECAYDGVRVDF